jgi:hypothetical protein
MWLELHKFYSVLTEVLALRSSGCHIHTCSGGTHREFRGTELSAPWVGLEARKMARIWLLVDGVGIIFQVLIKSIQYYSLGSL